MFYIEKKPETKLKAAALMYQLVDDFILNDSELAIKYQNDAIRSIENKRGIDFIIKFSFIVFFFKSGKIF